MQDELKNKMLQLTWDCLKNFWQGNVDNFLHYCGADISWIGETPHHVEHSLEDIREELSRHSIDKKNCRMNGKEFHVSVCEATVIVMGSYETDAGENGENSRVTTQCCSFLWDISKEQPLIRHIHMSTPTGKNSSEGKKKDKLVIQGHNGVVSTVSQSDIVYLEACNKEVRLHLTKGTCTIRGGLMENYGLLSECFLKIHRKYIVNLKHITGVKPYAVCTSTSEEVPIPARHYRAVRQRIMDAMVCL